MTRAEIIAKVEAVCREQGWNCIEVMVAFGPRYLSVAATDASWARVEIHECNPVTMRGPIQVYPRIDAAGDASCTQAVADWPLIQTMIRVLRDALGVQS